MTDGDNKKKVVIIGGGIGGLAAAKGLRDQDKNVQITLVEPKDYVEAIWASFRILFDENLADQATVLLAPWATKHDVTHVRSTAVGVDNEARTVSLADGSTLDYDVVLVATGAKIKWPGMGKGLPSHIGLGSDEDGSGATKQARLAQAKAEGERLLNSESVIIIGGGLVGVETAGDLAVYAKKADKKLKVTLVHSGDHLVPEMSPPAAAMLQRKLENVGITVVLNDRAVVADDGSVTLQSNGKSVEGKSVLYTVGIFPINSFLDGQYLDDKGYIDIDEYFRVRNGKGRMFALGDCCNANMPKAGNQIMEQVATIGKNMKRALDSADDGKLKAYKPILEGYVVTVGDSDGVAYIKGFTYTQYVLPSLKNKTFFLFKMRSSLGMP